MIIVLNCWRLCVDTLILSNKVLTLFHLIVLGTKGTELRTCQQGKTLLFIIVAIHHQTTIQECTIVQGIHGNLKLNNIVALPRACDRRS